MANSQKFLLLILFIVMVLGNHSPVSASTIIPVENKACKYTVTLPPDWDTIPQTFLKEKLKEFNVDLGIYPVSQSDYTNGNYALICFMPTIQSLNAFSFKQIVADITQSNEMSELKSDTLRIHFDQIDTEVRDGKYFIYNNFFIMKNTIPVENWQMLYLTKFGYVSVMFYARENGTVSIDKAPALFSRAITVQSDYQYREYVKKAFH